MVECHLAKVKVAGPNPVSRSTRKRKDTLKSVSDISKSDNDRKSVFVAMICVLSSVGRATDS